MLSFHGAPSLNSLTLAQLEPYLLIEVEVFSHGSPRSSRPAQLIPVLEEGVPRLGDPAWIRITWLGRTLIFWLI